MLIQMKAHIKQYKTLYFITAVIVSLIVFKAIEIMHEPTKEELEVFKQHRKSIGQP